MQSIQGKSPMKDYRWRNKIKSSREPVLSRFTSKYLKHLRLPPKRRIKLHLPILFCIRHLHPSISSFSPPFYPSTPSSLHQHPHHHSHPFIFIKGSKKGNSNLNLVRLYLFIFSNRTKTTRMSAWKCRNNGRKKWESERDHITTSNALGSSALTSTEQPLVYPSASILGLLR